MENTFAMIKTDFIKLVNLIHKINGIKLSIHVMLTRFRHTYDDIVKLNNTKNHFLVCLEALHFQYKVLITENDNLNKMFLMLLNRAYRDYFNCYNTIVKELARYEIAQPNVANQHAIYKDTESFAEFQIEEISLVFENVNTLISAILIKHAENENVVQQYKVRSSIGIFIGNLISTIEYDNSVLEDHAKLFLKNIDFSVKTQTVYLTKMLKRFETMLDDINTEVMLHDSQWDNSAMSVSDQLLQATDDGEPRVSQWKPYESGEVVGITISELSPDT